MSPRVTRRRLLAGLATTATAGSAGCLGSSPRTAHTPSGDADIGFGGDVMLGRSVDEGRADDPPAAVWGDLHGRLQSLDGCCWNLECALSTRGRPRPGWTYHFRADPAWAIPALEAGNTAWVSRANNHQLDFGPAALRETGDSLTAAGIAHSGAGPGIREALSPAVVDVGEVRVAFLSLTDQAPSYAAGWSTPGTAFLPLDARRPAVRRTVGSMLERARDAAPDLVVASLHWGPNWVVTPAEQYVKFGRWLVEQGVDVVHGHSAHVVQGVEIHRGRPIIHDAGDALDDYVIKDDLHNDRSFLFEVGVRDGVPASLRLVPIEIDALAVHRADAEAAAWLRERMRGLSAPFGTGFERDGAALVCTL